MVNQIKIHEINDVLGYDASDIRSLKLVYFKLCSKNRYRRCFINQKVYDEMKEPKDLTLADLEKMIDSKLLQTEIKHFMDSEEATVRFNGYFEQKKKELGAAYNKNELILDAAKYINLEKPGFMIEFGINLKKAMTKNVGILGKDGSLVGIVHLENSQFELLKEGYDLYESLATPKLCGLLKNEYQKGRLDEQTRKLIEVASLLNNTNKIVITLKNKEQIKVNKRSRIRNVKWNLGDLVKVDGQTGEFVLYINPDMTTSKDRKIIGITNEKCIPFKDVYTIVEDVPVSEDN